MTATLAPVDRKAAHAYLADLKTQFRSSDRDAQRGLYREITEVEYALKHSPGSVAGRIVALDDYQVKKGEPLMGVRITLETVLGDEASRVVVWVGDMPTLQAIAKAVKTAGATDLEIGADLALTRTEECYTAAYARP